MRLASYVLSIRFQSTYLYKVRLKKGINIITNNSFNPRTYIRYDSSCFSGLFSTNSFQSTYLYKVRRVALISVRAYQSFNPRTYIRYDIREPFEFLHYLSFNPRTYIRYDRYSGAGLTNEQMFQSTYLYKVRQIDAICISNSP